MANRTVFDTASRTPSVARTVAVMSSISANTLKTRGVSAIAEALNEASEAMVSVRGFQCAARTASL